MKTPRKHMFFEVWDNLLSFTPKFNQETDFINFDVHYGREGIYHGNCQICRGGNVINHCPELKYCYGN